MEQPKKIDRTLTERLLILRLLERLKADTVTIDEMDEIGAKLSKAGRRALSPLVRRLWRERSGDVISRYAYLLDFFEDESWLDQLVQMVLRRRDLEGEAQAAFLAALEGYGVDVSAPPFARLPGGAGGPLRLTLPRLLDRGEEGLLCFIEDLLFYPPDLRGEVIRQLPSVADPRVMKVMGVLTGIDDEEIAREAVIALGRMRCRDSVLLLHGLVDNPDPAIGELARRSLRRLSFLGVAWAPEPPSTPSPFSSCYASPVDGAGYRTLWFSRPSAGGGVTALYLELHETRGITSVWGEEGLAEEACARHLTEIGGEDALMEVPPHYALLLLRDARFRGREQGTFPPAEFYLRRGIFLPAEIVPAPYSPVFDDCLPAEECASFPQEGDGAALFEDDCFGGWFLADPRVYDLAEEWIALEEGGGGRVSAGTEALVERFCRELLAPDLELIRGRLLLTADLMRVSGRSGEAVGQVVATAMELAAPAISPAHHPFLRRYAMESMQMAREALAEGYDPRQHFEDGDGEWE